jgi:cation transport ATPase
MRTLKSNIKKTAMLFIALIMLTPVFAQQKKRTAKAVIKTSIHCDHCKKCESCGGRFEREMYAINGIKTYEINMKDTTIVVVYNPLKVTPEIIKTAISKMGYDADEVKADPVAYEKLDECCKK